MTRVSQIIKGGAGGGRQKGRDACLCLCCVYFCFVSKFDGLF